MRRSPPPSAQTFGTERVLKIRSERHMMGHAGCRNIDMSGGCMRTPLKRWRPSLCLKPGIGLGEVVQGDEYAKPSDRRHVDRIPGGQLGKARGNRGLPQQCFKDGRDIQAVRSKGKSGRNGPIKLSPSLC
jgi:hypothetical protein